MSGRKAARKKPRQTDLTEFLETARAAQRAAQAAAAANLGPTEGLEHVATVDTVERQADEELLHVTEAWLADVAAEHERGELDADAPIPYRLNSDPGDES